MGSVSNALTLLSNCRTLADVLKKTSMKSDRNAASVMAQLELEKTIERRKNVLARDVDEGRHS